MKTLYRRARIRVAGLRMVLIPGVSAPDGLVAAPTDLHAVDPFVAEELLNGRIVLAGRVYELDGVSVFADELPNLAFAESLYSFEWLRHVRAHRTNECCAKARQLVAEWMALHGRRARGLAWESDIAARRLIALLSHSPVVLNDAESGFYRRFMKTLGFHVRYLGMIARFAPDGETRLRIHIALAVASICMSGKQSWVSRQARKLSREMERQILPDGGHVSRNPRVLLDLLLDLLPLRHSYINLGHTVPSGLVSAIDRIFPALRFFRHQDGDLALFNGATSTLANELAAVLRYDDTAGLTTRELPDMAYQRLVAGDTTVLIDTGRALSVELSSTAHAGCLSFEMSAGRYRFIVNSGSPENGSVELKELARSTAAHSTVTLADTSSCRFSRSAFLGPIMVQGAREVTVNRTTGPNGNDIVSATHDGYVADFGYLHEREVDMNEAGTRIRGRDIVSVAGKNNKHIPESLLAVARFHVHPIIELSQLNDETVVLTAPDGTRWQFSVPGRALAITDDIFMANVSGPRRSQQIEVAFEVPEVREIRWFLDRKA
jgi:uncharacterized heparinase superfamily protein